MVFWWQAVPRMLLPSIGRWRLDNAASNMLTTHLKLKLIYIDLHWPYMIIKEPGIISLELSSVPRKQYQIDVLLESYSLLLYFMIIPYCHNLWLSEQLTEPQKLDLCQKCRLIYSIWPEGSNDWCLGWE